MSKYLTTLFLLNNIPGLYLFNNLSIRAEAILKASNTNFLLINFTRNQPFFSVLNNFFAPTLSLSGRRIFCLLGFFSKAYKRDAKRYHVLSYFFKFYLLNFLDFATLIFFNGFKKKYFNLLKMMLSILYLAFPSNFYLFNLAPSMNKYTFKKVKAIKKRIRKKLIKLK